MSAKRVLLMYITEVSGHHQATKAIERALKDLDPSVETLKVNGFRYAYPIVEKIVNTAYMGVIKRTPKIWDYLYDNPKIFRKTKAIKEAIHKSRHQKFAKLFEEFNPDVVICTQAFPCGMVADYKISRGLNTKIIAVLTDHAAHSFWINEGVDYYVVPSEDEKALFVQKGVAEDKIRVYGIPVDAKFARPVSKEKIASALGLDIRQPAILIMGGGQGLGPIKRIVKSLSVLTTPFQLMVVAGTNKKLNAWLGKTRKKCAHKMIVYQFADNVDELMSLATFAISKPGGMTTAESLTKGLPLVIVKPIPGQEVRNTEFLLKKGIAVRIDRLNNFGQEIEALLNAPDRLEKMRQAAFSQGRPQAAGDIARLALGRN